MSKSSSSIALLISGLLWGVISPSAHAMPTPKEEEPQGARPKAVVACTKTPISDGMTLFREEKYEEAAKLFLPYLEKAPIVRAYWRELAKKELLPPVPKDSLDSHKEQSFADRWYHATKEFKKLSQKEEKKTLRTLKQSKDGPLLYLFGWLYETKGDKQKAKELYKQAFDYGEIKGALGLARVLDKGALKNTLLEDCGDIDLDYFNTLYNACCISTEDEGEAFWRMKEKLEPKVKGKKNSGLYAHCLYAAALHGNHKAQYLYASGAETKKQLDQSLFWLQQAIKQEPSYGKNFFIGLLEKGKNPSDLAYLEEIVAARSFTADDCLELIPTLIENGGGDQAKKWRQKALEKMSPEECFTYGKRLADVAQHEEALPFLEKSKHISDEAKYRHLLSFHFQNPEQELSEDFKKNLFENASESDFPSLLMLAILVGEGSIDYNPAKLLALLKKGSNTNKDCIVRGVYAKALRHTHPQEALELFSTLSKSLQDLCSDDIAACYYTLGTAYCLGQCGLSDPDPKQAEDCWRKAYEKGSKEALISLMCMKMEAGGEEEKAFFEECTPGELVFLTPYKEAYQNIKAEGQVEETSSDDSFSPDTSDEVVEAPGRKQDETSAFSFDEVRSSSPLSTAHQETTSQPSTPKKKLSSSACPSPKPFPKQMEKMRSQERTRKDSEKADEAKQMLRGKKPLKLRTLNAVLNRINRIIKIEIAPGNGSVVHVQIGGQKTGFHQPHGANQDVNKVALRCLARQLSEAMKEN